MFYFFSKLLQPILWPTNAAMVLLVAMLALFAFKRDRLAKSAGGLALAILWIAGLPILAIPLVGSLERSFPILTVSEARHADAIVVLGGTVLGVQPPRREVQEVFGSRVMSAGRLYRAGKSKVIIVSSGVRYILPNGVERTDARDMRELLETENVPANAIWEEDQSRNTDENASYTVSLLNAKNIKSILLVTSAFHMRRSMAMFHKYGFTDVQAYPVEVRVTHAPVTFFDLLPDPGSLGMTTIAIKEHIGSLFY
jgi:uncharacterized SAM-binding protein YcdF (DUF218 family)